MKSNTYLVSQILEKLRKDTKHQQRLALARATPKNLNAKYGKPPKLRYQPGDFVEYEGEVWIVKYIYRLKSDPHAWKHVLENMPTHLTLVDEYVASLNLGDGIPLIVYDPIWNANDLKEQLWLPCWGNSRIHLSTKNMLNKTKKLS